MAIEPGTLVYQSSTGGSRGGARGLKPPPKWKGVQREKKLLPRKFEKKKIQSNLITFLFLLWTSCVT